MLRALNAQREPWMERVRSLGRAGENRRVLASPLSGLAAKQTHDNDELSAPVVAQPFLELSERYDSIQLCTHSKNMNILFYDTCGVHQSWKDSLGSVLVSPS